MLRKLTKRITNNFGLKVLAAVFAIVIWLVVVNIEDPEKTKGFTIPVTIENSDYLADMGKTYDILNNSDKISFTVTGNDPSLRNCQILILPLWRIWKISMTN